MAIFEIKPSLFNLNDTASDGDAPSDKWVNTNRTDNSHIRITIDLPGARASDLSLTVTEDGVLRLIGGRRLPARDGSIANSRIFRSFKVDPQKVALNKFRANLVDGILTIEVPRVMPSSTRRIEVGVDEG